MPLLPQPSTTSPGALQLLYQVGALEHVTSANLVEGVDVGDLVNIRAAAQTFGEILADILTDISFVSGWRIVDPSGVSLYEEAFGTAIVGNRAPDGSEVGAQSVTGTITGKGRPAVGLAQGQTRTVVFLGSFSPENWGDAKEALDAGAVNFGPLRDFLTNNDYIGADQYGTKVTYHPYFLPQINAHYQKKYGL
jgi:hypothetical protein